MKLKLYLTLTLLLIVHFAKSQQTTPYLERLVQRYAPLLRHHYAEEYLPSSAEWYLNRSNLYKEGEKVADLSNGNWEKLWTEAQATGNASADRKWYTHRKSSSTNKGNISTSKAYVHIKLANYQPYPKFDFDIEIQYWFFWPYNDATDNLGISDHHGDWEGVTVVLNSNGYFKYLLTTTHGDRNYYESKDLERAARPATFSTDLNAVIHVARKSHALYNKNGEYNRVAAKYRDKVEGRVGVKEVKSWNSYEIVEIDPRIQESGIIPTNPRWMEFGGNWGATISEKITIRVPNVLLFWIKKEITTSNSPRFAKYDKPEWEGRYNEGDIFISKSREKDPSTIDLPFDYSIFYGSKAGLKISGISSNNCANSDFKLSINRNVDKKVSWTLPSNAFTKYSGITYNNNTFNTSGKNRTASDKILAKVSIPQPLDYNAEFNLIKRFNLKKPTESDYSITSHVTNYNSTYCKVTFILQNESGIPIKNVNWYKVGGDGTLISSNNNQAIYRVRKNMTINLATEINACSNKLTLLSTKNASCGSFSGGGIGGGNPNIQRQPSSIKRPQTDIQGIFPNPTNGPFKISLGQKLENVNEVSIQILELSGKIIQQEKGISLESAVLDLNFPQLESGTYLVKVTSRETILYQGKLIKQ